MSLQKTRLILVYNADSGIFNALIHAVHKQLFPATYPCSLCALTYGAVSMHGDWRRFLDELACKVVIHHKDDFTAAFPDLGEGGPREAALPAILLERAHTPGASNEPNVLISASELDAMKDAGELMERVHSKLNAEFGSYGAAAKAY